MFKKKPEVKLEHEWGKEVAMIPAVKRCGRCGNFKQVGPGYRVNLPDEVNKHLTDTIEEGYTYCTAQPRYTQFQYDNAVENTHFSSWSEGQRSGIHLQPEFTQQFFKKIRKNPTTLVYEIPQETYEILKDKLLATPTKRV